MKNFRLILCISLLGAWITSTSGQDIHFSQYDRTPLQVNPAQAGNFDGKLRAQASYRNQWSRILKGDAYNTYFLSFDSKILNRGNQSFSLGLTGSLDKAGELNYGAKQIHISGAYELAVGGTEYTQHLISAGVEFGIVKRRIDITGARWPSQHDGNGGWDPTSSVEFPNGFRSDVNYGDVNLGIKWQSDFKKNQSFYFGFAGHHLNKPKISFYTQGEEALTHRLTFHGGGEISIGRTWSLVPSFLYLSQGAHNALTAGTSIKKYFGKEAYARAVQLGAFLRGGKDLVGDFETGSFILMANLNLKRFSVGISVDSIGRTMNTSTSDAIRFNGAWEFSLGYVFGKIDGSSLELPE